MHTRRKLAAVAAGLVVVAAGCSGATDDLDGVQAVDPARIEVITQPDKFPNLLRTCLGGLAWLTTTRDYAEPIRVEEWDQWCAAKDGKS